MNSDCEICEIIRELHRDVIIVETEYWRVVLNPNQVYLATAWVTLKTHVGSISELTEGQWEDLHSVIKRYEGAVRRAFGAKLFNWSCLMNDAFKATRPVPHVHWHVKPRYDKLVNITGIEFDDPNFAHHYQLKSERVADSLMANEIAGRLRDNL